MGATLVVKGGKADRKQYTLDPGHDYYIGRHRDAEVKVRDQQASRRHCKIRGHSDGTWTVSDQHSSNGTYVNDKRISRRELKDGDVVSIGHARFEFRLGTKPSMDELEALAAPEGVAPQPINVAGVLGGNAQESAQAEDSDMVHDSELMELFAFLDQVEDGEPSRSGEEVVDEGAQEPLLSFASEEAGPSSEDKEPENGDAPPVFDIAGSAEAGESTPAEGPAAKPDEPDDQDGLLAFLRKKGQS
jgi:predicted component of type VI protein secretion system